MCVCIYIGGCHAYPTICPQLSITFTLSDGRQRQRDRQKKQSICSVLFIDKKNSV